MTSDQYLFLLTMAQVTPTLWLALTVLSVAVPPRGKRSPWIERIPVVVHGVVFILGGLSELAIVEALYEHSNGGGSDPRFISAVSLVAVGAVSYQAAVLALVFMGRYSRIIRSEEPPALPKEHEGPDGGVGQT